MGYDKSSIKDEAGISPNIFDNLYSRAPKLFDSTTGNIRKRVPTTDDNSRYP
jgi:hypothetical protein